MYVEPFAFAYKVCPLVDIVYVPVTPVEDPFVALHPTEVYPVFGVILGRVTLHEVPLVTLHVPPVEPIDDTFAPFS